jgi:hypothetical protein
VMVKAAPATAFVVSETDFLLEFEIVALNPPAQFRLIGICSTPIFAAS